MFWQGITSSSPIKFGTDGWRGVIGAEFTFERLIRAAQAAALVLDTTYGPSSKSQQIIVGYDRRFLAEEFAQAVAETLKELGFDVLLGNQFAPTPAFSWAVKQHKALGALVITASHNPGIYSGLKVKGAFAGSVPPEVTAKIEEELTRPHLHIQARTGSMTPFDPWPSYCQALQEKVDLPAIQTAIKTHHLTVWADVMHGSAAGGLGRILGEPIQELNSERDPLFGGGAPEPIGKYLQASCATIRQAAQETQGKTVGLVFDGDADRIAAIDAQGNLLTAQQLIPILIDHLTVQHGYRGEVIKSISSSDLIPKVVALHGLSLYETPIGFKYIGDRMLMGEDVLLGGEESGGIGYGNHTPERDALLSALYVLEAVVKSGLDLAAYYQSLQVKTGFTSYYDRIDLHLPNLAVKDKLQHLLETNPPQTVFTTPVEKLQTIDGFKFHLGDHGWLLIRFSGTEPLLRLYCESTSPEQVQATLNWTKAWAEAAS
ncbi:phosphoglucomutase/phosphomannomutase family protein [Thermosynechococcaceae cyanobacterium BACA0444]|uniref:Phosphoglucomutase/phosphomannomutase family protein n=1 Tax=Pseudocalidococcus azoricus BACA0444 TaxID=2918990 RepID=A0AAE4FQG9_9CYAN|nr:phosphoglucomutase/phosphomannomutase family protein [Pseudocalidococcus azoricus]MDS3860296.1 phosphoglucomutase/phosphomannomutase family protein [Pseudocalidococcus azoricus BACA0444]